MAIGACHRRPAGNVQMRYHYLWTWTDRGAGQIRARMFAPDLGVP